MTGSVYLTACAALSPEGIRVNSTRSAWREGQSGAADVTRAQVLPHPYPGFGKLPLAEKIGFSVASLVLNDHPLPPDTLSGIALGTPLGSLSNDLRFMESIESGFPSPGIFWATLPSAAVSEVAIYYKLRGPNRVFSQLRGSGASALECAHRMLLLGKAENMLVLYVNAVERREREQPYVPDSVHAQSVSFAFLLSTRDDTGGFARRCSVSCRPVGQSTDESGDEELLGRVLDIAAGEIDGTAEACIDRQSFCVSIEKDG